MDGLKGFADALDRVAFAPKPSPIREQLIRSHDLLDAAELLRTAAIELRSQAKKLDWLANRLDPPLSPQTQTLGA